MADELALKPLQHSWEANDLEADIKAITLQLFEQFLRAQSDEINVYGAPHLGSFALVERNVSRDGLTVLRQGDESPMRYLFKAWRYRNPRRGFHFLRTYLTVLFGTVHQVDQLWQKKSFPYPTALKSGEEMGWDGESESDYYLTSRVRVDLDTDLVPDRVLRSLRTTVAARFLLDVRIRKQFESKFGIAQLVSRPTVICYATGEATLPITVTASEFGIASLSAGLTSILYASGTS